MFALGGAGLLALALLYAYDPAEHARFLECPLHKLTAVWCAGCGGQRALHALLHGQLHHALALNLVAVLGLPVAAYLYTAWALQVLAAIRMPLPRPTPQRVACLVLACLVYAVVRNLPGFAWLAPV
jgi:hypothetical protein